MPLYVQVTGASGTITLDVEPSDSVENVKAKVQDVALYPSARQHLFFNNAELDNGQTLADYGVKKNDTLTLTIDMSQGCTNLNDPAWDGAYSDSRYPTGASVRRVAAGPLEVAVFTATRTAGDATAPNGIVGAVLRKAGPFTPFPWSYYEAFPAYVDGVSSVAVPLVDTYLGEEGGFDWYSADVSWTVRCGADVNGNKIIDSDEVPKTPVIITADNLSKTYGDADPTLTYQVTGLADGDTLTKNPTCLRGAGENAGTKAVTCSGAEAASKYQITYVPGSLNITKRALTVTPDGQSITYRDALPSSYPYAVTSGSLVPGDQVTGTCGVVGTPKNAGTYPITCPTLTAGSNYDLTVGAANLIIAKKDGVVTPDAKTVTFGDEDPTFTYTISGVGDDDTLDTNPTCGVSGAHANAGQYRITCSGGADKNYTLNQTATSILTVNKAPVTVTANNASKVYGSPDPTFTSTVTGDGTVTGVTCGVAGGHTNVGAYPIACSGGSAGSNYTITYKPGTLTVTKAALTLTADNKSRTTDQANPTLTYTTAGLVNADTPATAFTGVPVLSTTATPASPVGTYPISISAGSVVSANYNVAYMPGLLTISMPQPAKVAITTSATGGLTNLLTLGTTFTATVKKATSGEPVAGMVVTFRITATGKVQCTATTNSAGAASCRVGNINMGTPYTAETVASNNYEAGRATGMVSLL